MASTDGGKAPAKAPESQRPVNEIRMGRVRVAAWRNVTAEGEEWFSFVPSRSFKEGDQWRSAASFGVDDLLALAEVCRSMRLWAEEQRQARQKKAIAGQDKEQEGGAAGPF